MQEYLVFSAVGQDRPGIVSAVSRAATASNCNIMDTRMTVLGAEFALLMMVSGQSEDIEQASQALSLVADNLSLLSLQKRTEAAVSAAPMQACEILVEALDHPGIVSDIAGFVSDQGINVENLETTMESAAHTGSPIFKLKMTVTVPTAIALDGFTEDLCGYCDQRGLDVTIDPQQAGPAAATTDPN